MRIRPLTAGDLPQLLALTDAAHWNHLPEDWLRVLRLAGADAWGVEHEGSLVASTTAVTYPGGAAWIGMVLTHPDWRGRGVARALMTHALDQLDSTGVTCQKLDATDMGKPLYHSLGFEELFAVERWEGLAVRFPPDPLPRVKLPDCLELDREAFREDRRALLGELSGQQSASLGSAGHAFARDGKHARFFGPCVAMDAECARRLAQSLLSPHAGAKFYWDLIPGHTAASNLAKELGFRPVRRLVRMRRGCGTASEPWPQRKIFALAGFEFG